MRYKVNREMRDLGVESFSTDKGHITRSLSLDKSEWNPHPAEGVLNAGDTFPNLAPSKSITNPILVGSDIGVTADFVADPFAFSTGDSVYIFYEYFDDDGGKQIYRSEVSFWGSESVQDTTGNIMGETGFAYPLVQRLNGEVIMTPDTFTKNGGSGDFEIWKPDNGNIYDSSWSMDEKPLTGVGSDPTPVYHYRQERYYLIQGYENQNGVRLYYSDKGESITGRSWTEHPESPIFPSSNSEGIQGPAGRAWVFHDGTIEMPFQEISSNKTVTYRLVNITTNNVTLKKGRDPLTRKSERPGDWREIESHHVDYHPESVAGEPFALIDGRGSDGFAIGWYQSSDAPPSLTKIKAASNTPLPSNSITTVTLDDVEIDELGQRSGDAIKVATGGDWDIRGQVRVRLSDGTTPHVFNLILTNISTGERLNEERYGVSYQDQLTFGVHYQGHVPEGDSVVMRVYHESGAEEKVTDTRDGTYLRAEKL